MLFRSPHFGVDGVLQMNPSGVALSKRILTLPTSNAATTDVVEAFLILTVLHESGFFGCRLVEDLVFPLNNNFFNHVFYVFCCE